VARKVLQAWFWGTAVHSSIPRWRSTTVSSLKKLQLQPSVWIIEVAPNEERTKVGGGNLDTGTIPTRDRNRKKSKYPPNQAPSRSGSLTIGRCPLSASTDNCPSWLQADEGQVASEGVSVLVKIRSQLVGIVRNTSGLELDDVPALRAHPK
jgi:hypothetical protein